MLMNTDEYKNALDRIVGTAAEKSRKAECHSKGIR